MHTIHDLVKLLKCIKCDSQTLHLENTNKLVCKKCNTSYAIKDGIPIFLPSPEIAEKPQISIFEKHINHYDAWFEKPKGKILFINEVKAIRKLIEDKTYEKSIEIGVGTGRFAQALHIKYGIDPSFSALLLAKKRGINVVQGIAEKLPFKSEIFEIAFIIVTICYVQDPLMTLVEAHRVLKKNGLLVIGYIEKESPWGKAYLMKKKRGHVLYKPARFFSFNEIRDLLYKAKFEILKVVSTLNRLPQEKPTLEKPIEGYKKDCGFIAILAQKVPIKSKFLDLL